MRWNLGVTAPEGPATRELPARRYRFDLLRAIRDVVSAPFSDVTFANNVMGDIITSFTHPIPDLMSTIGCAEHDATLA